jgi:redox-sensing transcriptional repressor
MENSNPIAVFTIKRLSIYLRSLLQLKNEGKHYVSSIEIAELNGFTSAQVRKDLSVFGNFGVKGKGYNIDNLITGLNRILGLNKKISVSLFGLGRLGEALLENKGFQRQGFEFVAIFDIDRTKIGRKFNNIVVHHPDELPQIASKLKIDIAIVTVPNENAKKTLQSIVEARIRGIFNFTDARIQLPEGFYMQNVNLAGELETISYFISQKNK